MNEKFDTAVQELKYKVLKEVAISAFNDSLLEDYSEIPYKIVTGNVPTFRDSIDKERMIDRRILDDDMHLFPRDVMKRSAGVDGHRRY